MKIKLGHGKMSADDIARYSGGELYNYTRDAALEIGFVCTDSREADADTLFIATRGERVDGHDFIIGALDGGCRCVLCEYVPTNIAGREAAFITVENSFDAFAHLAKGYMESIKLDTVAITGSVGKTTTKELCASILGIEKKLYATSGNYNSVIGMPMSLMNVPDTCDTAVFEMGMSARGEIRCMTCAAEPKIAMIVNVGSSHLEYLGTRDNIARAKLEIAEGLGDGGILILNGDEPLLRKYAKKGRYDTLYLSIEDGKADILADNITVGDEYTSFDLCFKGKRIESLKINLIGKQFVYNASFASAAALLLGASESAVRDGLSAYIPSGMRQSIKRMNGITVISDCYNAAPESMRAAIDTLCALNVSGRRIAVLGDMRELGCGSERMHSEIGEYLARSRVDHLISFGELGSFIAEGAISAGMNARDVFAECDSENIDALCCEISHRMREGDAILFKASRSMALERAIEKLFGKQ